MDESRASTAAWIAAVLACDLGLRSMEVVHVEQRMDFDLYRADGGSRALLVKVASPARIAQEAHNLRLAQALGGQLTPALVGSAEMSDVLALLAMDVSPDLHVEPGRLSHAAWRRLRDCLLRLHAQGPGGPPRCAPLLADFLSLGPEENRPAGLAELRPMLADVTRDVTGLEAGAALRLYDDLVADVTQRPTLFERPQRYVYSRVRPESVLTAGAHTCLLDWYGLTCSDYALDLANLKLTLDSMWPAWRAQRTFEALLRHYAVVFDDTALFARMQFYMPFAALALAVQAGADGLTDRDGAAVVRACLGAAQRDRTLWRQEDPTSRLVYTLVDPPPRLYQALQAARPLPIRVGRAVRHRLRLVGRSARRSLDGDGAMHRVAL